MIHFMQCFNTGRLTSKLMLLPEKPFRAVSNGDARYYYSMKEGKRKGKRIGIECFARNGEGCDAI
jgi:hypothetical protein